MRSSKSRSRGNKNRNNRPSGGNIINRVFDSSGPDGKVRGTPQQIIDKYNQLHRDAQLSNDRVAAENFAQHAEHYTRLLAEAQREVDKVREDQEEQNRQRQAERDRERAARMKAQEEAGTGGSSGDDSPADAVAEAKPDAKPQQERRKPRRREPEDADQPGLDIRSVGFLNVDTDDGFDADDSGLVETPEARSSSDKPAAATDAGDKPRRARKPRRKPSDAGGEGTPDDGQKASAE
jgi:hypothetical protein